MRSGTEASIFSMTKIVTTCICPKGWKWNAPKHSGTGLNYTRPPNICDEENWHFTSEVKTHSYLFDSGHFGRRKYRRLCQQLTGRSNHVRFHKNVGNYRHEHNRQVCVRSLVSATLNSFRRPFPLRLVNSLSLLFQAVQAATRWATSLFDIAGKMTLHSAGFGGSNSHKQCPC